MELKTIMLNRRSGRKYNSQEVPEDVLKQILQAGLLPPSSRNLKPVELIAVSEKEALEALAAAKSAGSGMLKNADKAIVVIGDQARSDVWIEDCSIAMAYMMLKATELGVANCWVQIRCRTAKSETDGSPIVSETRVRALLGIPEQYGVLAILSLGMAEELPAPHTEEDADWKKVHYGKF